MIRSTVIGLVVTTALASSAHAVSPYQQAQQKQRALMVQKRVQDDQRAQLNRNNDLAKRQLGANRGDRAQRMASPFVNPNRAKPAWDARSHAATMRGSSIAPPRSIYDRMRTAPAPIKQQLASRSKVPSELKTAITEQPPVVNARRGGLLGAILFGPARWLQGVRNNYYASRGIVIRNRQRDEQLEEERAEEDHRTKSQVTKSRDAVRQREVRERDDHQKRAERTVFSALKAD